MQQQKGPPLRLATLGSGRDDGTLQRKPQKDEKLYRLPGRRLMFHPLASRTLLLGVEPAQLAPHDLARRGERQLGHELDLARIFVGGEPGLHVGRQLGLERLARRRVRAAAARRP